MTRRASDCRMTGEKKITKDLNVEKGNSFSKDTVRIIAIIRGLWKKNREGRKLRRTELLRKMGLLILESGNPRDEKDRGVIPINK